MSEILAGLSGIWCMHGYGFVGMDLSATTLRQRDLLEYVYTQLEKWLKAPPIPALKTTISNGFNTIPMLCPSASIVFEWGRHTQYRDKAWLQTKMISLPGSTHSTRHYLCIQQDHPLTGDNHVHAGCLISSSLLKAK